ncbi:hypothetical protein M5W83_10635 [Paenibacillus thiaminolyticus]|uniref:Uncharacterized protein n=1 Tax=Paenibacillus thiaminolyticus TaxID=49283 RepID=A0AAP9DTR4_PANTH|nr:hypothetical protein [Paenibacillus thiaminolyticus]MCY9533554.1 hypothetical protein [Paenibacillus thiaminolyticus]MCY9600776.1 hypothetical protein [Paenibacillus thiaminolyticus]MCY9607604.1 hypothetical protein [Paenibacillus thiaminolyticus]MCY9611404.1 hypothetical protein [Paenibacillus thiaminolyticus]MCY9617325.1 hypothetical protein [Paenibacillus thiaminolyticus]
MIRSPRFIYGSIIGLILLAGIVIYFFQIPLFTVNSGGELSVRYDTIQQLENDAELIVEAHAEKSKSFKHKSVIFTLSDVQVKQVYKGSVKPNEIIQVLETGGVYNNILHTFDDNKAIRSGDNALLFLKKYKGPVAQDAYTVLGVYQGKFNIDSNGVLLPSHHVTGELQNIQKISDLNLSQ